MITLLLLNIHHQQLHHFTIIKPVFHLATLFARRETKTRIRHRDWLKLAGKKKSLRTSRNCPYFFVCSLEQSRLVENGLYFYHHSPHLSLSLPTLSFNQRILFVGRNCREFHCGYSEPHVQAKRVLLAVILSGKRIKAGEF